MIDDRTTADAVARVTGRADPNAEAAAIAAHAKDPLKNPLPPASGDGSTAAAPEAGEAEGGRESEHTAEERSSTGDPEQPRETTGAGAGAEVARLVAEHAGLPAGSEDLLTGDVANMRRQAERLARYRDERTASPSGAESLTRRPSPALRPGYSRPPAIDAEDVARRARQG